MNEQTHEQNTPTPETDTPTNSTPDALQQCRQEIDVWKDRFVRMSADFENYKRRTEKEQTTWVRSGKVGILRNILPVIDTVELALADCAKRTSTPETESLLQGISMLGASFHKFLEASEVTEIKEVITFDPSLHDAIAQVDTDSYASNEIVEVLQKGYRFGDQILRPAKVAVAK